ncbi:glycosyltransferase family 39 protein [Candidatus Woesebacteria bacterium]|nr:glycosyltransferase family 39 protein [Candidatus Woesebacteria bacterium]
MKYLQDLLTNKTILILGIITLIPIFLHMRQIEWPCFNSDEASFAYNAYSILETGRDEYGSILPTRFKAFGENKLPVTIYSMVPGIAFFGLNEVAARLPFILIGIFSPLMFFLLTRKLTGNSSIGLIAAFLASISPWIQIMSRHIHENIIILALVIGILWYLSELHKKVTTRTLLMLAILVGIGLFTYHIGKVIAVFVMLWVGFLILFQKENKHHWKTAILLFAIPIVLFGITELMNPTSRISNLLFSSNQGFTLKIEELRKEHDERVLHNKVTHSIQVLSNQYLAYFSPEFLVRYGDNNDRFGYEGISPITPIESVLFLIGIFYAFHHKEKYRFLMTSLLLIAPVTAALSWQEYSLTRSFLLIIPILYFAAIAIYHLSHEVKKPLQILIAGAVLLIGIACFAFFSWDFYFNHYPKKLQATSAWQCGYEDVGTYIRENYDDFDRFYITKKLGQPYIFTLFYTQFAPEKYQKQASLSAPDEYGFGQVEQFDKFIFSFQHPDPQESAVVIGYPGEFSENVDQSRIQKVSLNNQEIFWIYEGQRKK